MSAGSAVSGSSIAATTVRVSGSETASPLAPLPVVHGRLRPAKVSSPSCSGTSSMVYCRMLPPPGRASPLGSPLRRRTSSSWPSRGCGEAIAWYPGGRLTTTCNGTGVPTCQAGASSGVGASSTVTCGTSAGAGITGPASSRANVNTAARRLTGTFSRGV